MLNISVTGCILWTNVHRNWTRSPGVSEAQPRHPKICEATPKGFLNFLKDLRGPTWAQDHSSPVSKRQKSSHGFRLLAPHDMLRRSTASWNLTNVQDTLCINPEAGGLSVLRSGRGKFNARERNSSRLLGVDVSTLGVECSSTYTYRTVDINPPNGGAAIGCYSRDFSTLGTGRLCMTSWA